MACTRLPPARASRMSRSPKNRQPDGAMTTLPSNWQSRTRSRSRDDAGQALIEMVFVTFMLVVLVFGMVDFGRAIMTRQIIVNLSREAANLASRGTALTNALKIEGNGYLILTVVAKDDSGQATIVDQQAVGGASATSKVGTGKGNPATLPNDQLPTTHQTLVAAEVFYRYVPITPVGKLLGIGQLTQLYDAAYF